MQVQLSFLWHLTHGSYLAGKDIEYNNSLGRLKIGGVLIINLGKDVYEPQPL